MENFGYLEIAIAQENNSHRSLNNTSKPNHRQSSTPSPQPSSKSTTAGAQKTDDLQVVGFWGLF
jgi:hypothetical protein